MKRIIKKMLRLVGYDIVRYSKFNDFVETEYRSDRDFFFIQIGANDGVSFDGLYDFVTTRYCKGIVVEPVDEYYKKLASHYEGFPEIVPVNVAIHKDQTSALIYKVDPEKMKDLPAWASGIASFDPDHHKRLKISSEDIVTEEIECVSFTQLVERYHVEHISLLQIDVEGYDLEIIKMIDFDVVKPRIIKFENLNFGKVELEEVYGLLRGVGYRVVIDGPDSLAVI